MPASLTDLQAAPVLTVISALSQTEIEQAGTFKHERVISDVPVHEVICGNDEGQVPLKKLNRHVQKLGRQVKPAEMTDILARIRAIDAHRPSVPMPKGPVPTSMKGMRAQQRGR